MTRIDAQVATQVADANRPQQAAADQQSQANEARRQELKRAEPRPGDAPSSDEVKSATETLKQVIEAATGRQLDFTLNDRFRELVVKISDRKSGEVVKEIPSKEFMKLRERLNDLIGLFVDEKA